MIRQTVGRFRYVFVLMVDKWRVRDYHMFVNREQEDIANK